MCPSFVSDHIFSNPHFVCCCRHRRRKIRRRRLKLTTSRVRRHRDVDLNNSIFLDYKRCPGWLSVKKGQKKAAVLLRGVRLLFYSRAPSQKVIKVVDITRKFWPSLCCWPPLYNWGCWCWVQGKRRRRRNEAELMGYCVLSFLFAFFPRESPKSLVVVFSLHHHRRTAEAKCSSSTRPFLDHHHRHHHCFFGRNG